MIAIKVKVETEIEKQLDLPDLYSEEHSCLGIGEIDCSNIKCENCLFEINNYKNF